MRVQDIIGNRHLIDTLFGSIATERPCGCYIIAGPAGTGKLTIAKLAAAAINCHHRTPEGYPCTECNSCRKILSGNHVDVLEVGLMDDKKQISVGQIKDLISINSYEASEADRKVFIIRDASALNLNAQNALLKSLEDPGDTIFFLLTDDIGAIIPTVKSRAFTLHTELLSDREIIKKLRETDLEKSDDEIRKTAHFAYGSLGRALAGADKSYFKNIDRVLEYFRAISEGARHAALCAILPPAQLTSADLKTVVNLMSDALRDILVFLETEEYGAENEYRFFGSDTDLLRKTSYMIGKAKAATLYDKLSELSLSLDFYPNIVSAASRINILFS